AGQHLVQRHVHGRRLGVAVDQLPVVFVPEGATHAVAPVSSARRTAIATPSGVMPYRLTDSSSAASTAALSPAWEVSAGRPHSAALMSPSAESGSRKKSPLTR